MREQGEKRTKKQIFFRVLKYVICTWILLELIATTIRVTVTYGNLPTPWWFYFFTAWIVTILIRLILEDLHKEECAKKMKKLSIIFLVLTLLGNIPQGLVAFLLGPQS